MGAGRSRDYRNLETTTSASASTQQTAETTDARLSEDGGELTASTASGTDAALLRELDEEAKENLNEFDPNQLVGYQVDVANAGQGIIAEFLQSNGGVHYFIVLMHNGERIVSPIAMTDRQDLLANGETKLLHKIY